jgi:hypothetical protein
MAASVHTKLTAVSHIAEGQFLHDTESRVKFVILQDGTVKPRLILLIQERKTFLSYEIME